MFPLFWDGQQGEDTMFWFQACPRCRGDIYQARDIYGFYRACVQCGHILTEEEETLLCLAQEGTAPSREPTRVR